MSRLKKKTTRIVGVLLIIALVGLLTGGCGQEKQTSKKGKNTITIGYLPITHALAVFEEKELLDQNKDGLHIQLQKFSSWTDLMDALNAGKIDGASVLAELAMGAVSQGVGLKAVALGHKDGNVFVVSDKIKSVDDLKGKTIAIPSNQSSHHLLVREALEKARLDVHDISLTQLAPTEMPASLASGAIDGYCVAEPFGAQAVVKGYGHVLYDSKELWQDSVCCALVLNENYIKSNEKNTKTFVDNYMKAGNELTKENALKIAKKYLGQDEKTLEASLEWIRFDDLKITKSVYEDLADKVKKADINGNPPTFEQFVYKAD